MKKNSTLTITILCFSLFFVQQLFSQIENRKDFGLIDKQSIEEASGLAVSRINQNILWTHNDSGDKNRIYAINTSGQDMGTYYINNVISRDWEDIAVGPGPVDGQSYIYIADIGDNRARYPLKYIYRVKEPRLNHEQSPNISTLTDVETITIKYEDGKRDAETIMVDPLTKDIYIVSKRETKVNVYIAPYPQSTKEVITLKKIAVLDIQMAVSGDISSTGMDILIKNYDTIFYWKKNDPTQKISDVLKQTPVILPYIEEAQGESVCWSQDNMGYFTISEERYNIPAHLYYYPLDSPIHKK